MSLFQHNKIDIDQILTTLENERLFNIESGDIQHEKNKLRQFFIKLDWDHFKNDLCKAFENDNDQKLIFWKTLTSDDMNFSADKRKRFYFISLFKYLKLSDLSQANVTDLLTTLINKYPNDENKNKNKNKTKDNDDDNKCIDRESLERSNQYYMSHVFVKMKKCCNYC